MTLLETALLISALLIAHRLLMRWVDDRADSRRTNERLERYCGRAER